MTACPVCPGNLRDVFRATLLSRHDVQYRHCDGCGLLQTEAPYWLEEAYSSAIADADTGLVARNLRLAPRLAALLYFWLEPDALYLDVAGGYGLLTRLMRDSGFDYRWTDPYCENVLARGFEGNAGAGPYAALTAFEVLEHVHDPVEFVSDALARYGADTLICSTVLYVDDVPPRDWWYYAFPTGQHITFYRHRTLATIAERLGLHFASVHGIHIFTKRRPGSAALTRLLTGRLAPVLAWYVRARLGSRTGSDHERMLGRDVEHC